MFENLKIENQVVDIPIPKGITLTIKQEDKNHPFVSGDKLRRLKYSIAEAIEQGRSTPLIFGGAYSNHIAATAAAGQIMGLRTIGVMRGDELESKISINPTLKFAKNCGMRFLFVTRQMYREEHTPGFLESLRNRYGSDTYIAPEGGTSALAVKGCEEILTGEDKAFDVIYTAVGTGGTISGFINANTPHQQIIGFPAPKSEFLTEVIKQYTVRTNRHLVHGYNFGGYAEMNDELTDLLNDFNKTTQIPLDPIYVSRMVFAIFALVRKEYFTPNTKILVIHTGGLQGIEGSNKERVKKREITLNYKEKI